MATKEKNKLGGLLDRLPFFLIFPVFQMNQFHGNLTSCVCICQKIAMTYQLHPLKNQRVMER